MHAARIASTVAALAVLIPLAVPGCAGGASKFSPPACTAPERKIRVDGDPSDWAGIEPQEVRGEDHLWFGQGMTREKWLGDADLSYSFQTAWSGDKLYFLFEVRDDKVLGPIQPQSFLCDCVEIFLDPEGRGGKRVEVLDGRSDWFEKYDPKEMRGWELHILPSDPPRVILHHAHKCAIDHPQTEEFLRDWAGEAATRRTPDGYVLEVGFAVPGLRLAPGKVLGLETGVDDDDGPGRKSILIWTRSKGDFWITMDQYGKVTLGGPARG